MGTHFRERESFVRILELTPALRRRIEATIEHLVSLLDAYDGDEDLEDGGDDEASLGWTERGPDSCLLAPYDDREMEDENDEDGGDYEPSLGAPERHPKSWEYAPLGVVSRERWPQHRVQEKSQEDWAIGSNDEREVEDEYDEDGNDDEHPLGWTIIGTEIGCLLVDGPELQNHG